jgi:hypothetical protein
MAKQVIALEATLNSGPAEGSVKSLKAQLREAQAEVGAMSDKFGLTSEQAQKAARRAAELKDAIGDAKLLTDAFNPDAKFKSFSNAIQGVVGGFSALQGAQALFGSESEDVAKVLAKVQGAMALSQGINSVLEAKDAFKVLGGVIRTNVVGAFTTLKGAIISTGIGVLIIAVGVLVEQLMAMSDAADEAAESQKKLNEQTKKFAEEGLKAELDYLNRTEKLEIAKAKQAGKSEEEIFAIQQSYRASRIRSQGRAYEELKNVDKSAALELKNQIKNANVEGQVAEIEHQIKLEEIRKKAAEDRRQKQKEENDKIKEDIKNANAEQNNLQKQLQDEITLSLIEDERQREQVKLEMDLEKAKKEVENSKASTKEKNESIALLEQQYMINLRDMQNQFAEEDAKKKKEQDEKDIQAEKDLNDVMLQLEKEAAEDRVKVAQAEAEQKKAIQDANFAVLDAGVGFLNQIAGKNKGLQKAAIIAENAVGIAKQIIANQTANAGALATPQAIATSGASAVPVILRNNIKTAIGVAATIAATAKALAAIGGGGSTGNVGNVGNNGGGGGGGTPSPIRPQLGQTALNQQMINATGNAAVRAFVLETDVSGNQERIKRLNRAARIN